MDYPLTFDAFAHLLSELDIAELASLYNTDSTLRSWLDSPEILSILTRLWEVPVGPGLPEIRSFKGFLREYYANYPSTDALNYFPLDFYFRYLAEEDRPILLPPLTNAMVKGENYTAEIMDILDILKGKEQLKSTERVLGTILTKSGEVYYPTLIEELLNLAPGWFREVIHFAVGRDDEELLNFAMNYGSPEEVYEAIFKSAVIYGNVALVEQTIAHVPKNRVRFHGRDVDKNIIRLQRILDKGFAAKGFRGKQDQRAYLNRFAKYRQVDDIEADARRKLADYQTIASYIERYS